MKLAIWTTVAMYLTNKVIESSSIVRHLLSVQKGDFFDWRHGKIFYTKKGSGAPLLLIHDLTPISSAKEWESVIDSLSEKYTVYAIDLLGCGRSDKPAITYSNYLYVELVSEFIDEIIQEETIVVATGMSASFVIMAAKLHPESFKDIFLVNPESFGKLSLIPTARTKCTKAILDFPIIGVSLYYLLTCRSQVDYEFTEKYFYNPFKVKDKAVLSYYEAAHLSGGKGRHLLASLKGGYVNFDVRKAVSELSNIHLIFGSELEYAQKISNSYVNLNSAIESTFIKKTKALPQLEAPQEFVSVICSQ